MVKYVEKNVIEYRCQMPESAFVILVLCDAVINECFEWSVIKITVNAQFSFISISMVLYYQPTIDL